MMMPSRRKLGAAALIIAGIGAFLVPFLLHSPSIQGTSSNNGGSTNPNNGSHTTNPNPTPTTTTGHSGDKDHGGKDKGDGGGTTDNDEGSSDTTGTCDTESSGHSDVSDHAGDESTGDNANDLSVSHSAKANTSGKSEGNHGHAFGLLKHEMDTTVALVKSMGAHNSAFHAHHDTKTDNGTVHTERANSEGSNDQESSCAESEETDDD
jgi:hypothetical protein